MGLRLGPLRARQAQPPQGFDQHVSQRRKIQPQLIGPQRLRAQPVREQVQLLLDAVFHLAARAVQLFVDFRSGPVLRAQRGNQVAWIFLALDLFRFGDHPPRSRPAFLGAIGELTEHPRRFSRAPVLLLGLVHGAADDPSQALVAREAEYIVHRAGFAPSQQLLPAKTRVGSQDDAGLRPPRANLPHDALHFFQTSRAGVDVRGPQPRTQQMISTENVQWQIAVVSVVAVEKPRLLLPVQRRVGGVQVQYDFARCFVVRFQKEIGQQFIQRFGAIADFVVAFRGRRTNRSQFAADARARAMNHKTKRQRSTKSRSCDRLGATTTTLPRWSIAHRKTPPPLDVKNVLQTERESGYTLSWKRPLFFGHQLRMNNAVMPEKAAFFHSYSTFCSYSW